jgi:hypothetical protein
LRVGKSHGNDAITKVEHGTILSPRRKTAIISLRLPKVLDGDELQWTVGGLCRRDAAPIMFRTGTDTK